MVRRRVGQFLRRTRDDAADDRGQAAFEFVLVLPFFILFVVLVIDFGILMYEYVSVSSAAREGARYGSVNCGDGSCTAAEVKTRTLARSGGILANASEVTVSWPNGVNRGSNVAVRVVHPYDFLFFPVTINVVSCADMRLEQQDSTAPSGGSGC